MTRDWQYPSIQDGATFHHYTDLHLGDTMLGAAADSRWMLRVLDDIKRFSHCHVAHVNTGDSVDNGFRTASQYPAYRTWRDSLAEDGLPILECVGNHDVRSNDPPTTAQMWADAMGLTKPNETLEVAGMKFIAPTPSIWNVGIDTGCTFTQDDLDWIDQEVTAAGSTPCWLLTHAAPHEQLPTADTPWTPEPRDSLVELISSHDNMAGWLSGHRHTRAFDFSVNTFTMGGKQLFGINGPSAGDLKDSQWTSWSSSLFVSFAGDSCTVRWRDHRGLCWPFSPRVLTR